MTNHAAEILRLFVAVELPDEVREALAALQADLRRRGLDGLRWVRPEGIHLTLKFLGETPSDKLPAIQSALAESVKGVPPHRLSLGPLGTFGSQRRPQVLWVDLQGDLAPLGRLQQQVDQALATVSFSRETRPFAPHLTVARIRRESAQALAPRLAEVVAAVRPPPANLDVRELSLMCSRLQPAGAVYERLAAFALG